MSRSKQEAASTGEVRIFKAVVTRGVQGKVVRGEEITEVDAVAERKAGQDVVVCGRDKRTNRHLARRIENAAGPSERHDPHYNQGPHALPHFQPKKRPPEGHTFYETDKGKAVRKP